MMMTITTTAMIHPITPPAIAPVLLSLVSPVLDDDDTVVAIVVVAVDDDDNVVVATAIDADDIMSVVVAAVAVDSIFVDEGINGAVIVGLDEGIVVDAAVVSGDINNDNGISNT